MINDQFAGIKSLAGWHCISWSLDSEAGNEANAGGPSVEGSIRNVALRYFESQEIAIRDLDRIHQRWWFRILMRLAAQQDSGRMRVSRSCNAGTSQQLQAVVRRNFSRASSRGYYRRRKRRSSDGVKQRNTWMCRRRNRSQSRGAGGWH